MNKVIIDGNLVKDMEVMFSKNGKCIGKFTVANNIGYGDKKITKYIPCTLFGDRVEKMQKYLLKGCKVLIEGSLDINNVKDDKGDWKNYTSVIVENVEILKFVNNDFVEDTDTIPYQLLTIDELRDECKKEKLKFSYKDSKEELVRKLSMEKSY